MGREGDATPPNMFPPTLSNQFIAREGEAPAEPGRRQARQEPRPPNYKQIHDINPDDLQGEGG